jgi:hypothetical protein
VPGGLPLAVGHWVGHRPPCSYRRKVAAALIGSSASTFVTHLSDLIHAVDSKKSTTAFEIYSIRGDATNSDMFKRQKIQTVELSGLHCPGYDISRYPESAHHVIDEYIFWGDVQIASAGTGISCHNMVTKQLETLGLKYHWAVDIAGCANTNSITPSSVIHNVASCLINVTPQGSHGTRHEAAQGSTWWSSRYGMLPT